MAKSPPYRGATLQEAVTAAAAQLEADGAETPMLDARLLLFASAGLSTEDYIRDPKRPLSNDEADVFTRVVARRSLGEPVSRILGRREFYGREFALGAGTLDPRPDTETVIEAVLKSFEPADGLRILDLGVGSGAILLTLLAELPGSVGVGADRSVEALRVARVNAQALGLAERAAFICGDWHAPLAGGSFDIVVANPPYIASDEIAGLTPDVRDHDPLLALDGGADGLDAYRAILADLPRILTPGGAVFCEIGETQSGPVAALMSDAGLALDEAAWLRRDLAGRPRCVVGKHQVRRSGAGLSGRKKELGTAPASG